MNAVATRTYPLFTAAGIAERVRTMVATGHHTSGQVAVLMALAVAQSALASEIDIESVIPEDRPTPSITVATVAAYTRLSQPTVQKHLTYWAASLNRTAVRRDLTSPFRAYFIGA
jgi:hypothetical protein